MTCLFFSFLLIYKTRPNDFDLQLGCCISDAFSIFFNIYTCIKIRVDRKRGKRIGGVMVSVIASSAIGCGF